MHSERFCKPQCMFHSGDRAEYRNIWMKENPCFTQDQSGGRKVECKEHLNRGQYKFQTWGLCGMMSLTQPSLNKPRLNMLKEMMVNYSSICSVIQTLSAVKPVQCYKMKPWPSSLILFLPLHPLPSVY